MAGRSLLLCLSQHSRGAPQTIPRFSDQSPFQLLSSRLGGGFDSFNHYRQLGCPDHGEPFNRSLTGILPLRCVLNLFSTSTLVSQVGSRSLVSWNRRELGWPGTTSGQTFSYSSSALAIEEDEAGWLAAEIGYEVLGQYVPEGPRIKPQATFAVVQVGSHQFKVSPGDMIYTEKLKYAFVNDKLKNDQSDSRHEDLGHSLFRFARITAAQALQNSIELLLNKVLFMGSLKQTIIGRPTIPEAGVLAAVEEIALDAKVIVFKKKRRKNYRRTGGHRQELTRLRILQIEGIEAPASASDDERLAENPV